MWGDSTAKEMWWRVALELYSCRLSISHAITNYSMALESQLLTYGPPRGLRDHLIPRPLRVSKKVQLSAHKDTFLQWSPPRTQLQSRESALTNYSHTIPYYPCSCGRLKTNGSNSVYWTLCVSYRYSGKASTCFISFPPHSYHIKKHYYFPNFSDKETEAEL